MKNGNDGDQQHERKGWCNKTCTCLWTCTNNIYMKFLANLAMTRNSTNIVIITIGLKSNRVFASVKCGNWICNCAWYILLLAHLHHIVVLVVVVENCTLNEHTSINPYNFLRCLVFELRKICLKICIFSRSFTLNKSKQLQFAFIIVTHNFNFQIFLTL